VAYVFIKSCLKKRRRLLTSEVSRVCGDHFQAALQYEIEKGFVDVNLNDAKNSHRGRRYASKQTIKGRP